MHVTFTKNDGGRAEAGYIGDAGDCVTRAIAIATEKPYVEVYDALFKSAKQYSEDRYNKVAKRIRAKGGSPRSGVHRPIYQAYLESIGWKWIATMKIGSGCKVHLRADELPSGRIIARVSKHICAVLDGIINDTYDCSRDGTRCVYGYFVKA